MVKSSSVTITAGYTQKIKNPGYSLYERLNLEMYIFDEIMGSIYPYQKEENLKEEQQSLKNDLDKIKDKLDELRKYYKPEFENRPEFKQQRRDFEQDLDEVRRMITTIVNQYELREATMIQQMYMGR